MDIPHTHHTHNIGRQKTLARVCVPITGFPIPGGMRSVLAGVAHVMGDHWQMTYLTHHKGQQAEGLEIELFGGKRASPWQFPNVWLYCLAGWRRLRALMRSGAPYDLILPQDGVFSGAFAALVGKMTGIPVVCMDHGNMTWLNNPALRTERMRAVQAYPMHQRLLLRLRYACYWCSLGLLAYITVRYSDLFLVAGDEVAEVYCQHLGVHASRIVRYAYVVDTARFSLLDSDAKSKIRVIQHIPTDAIVITMINRLATEKGMDVALEGIAKSIANLAPEQRKRVKVLIAGEGPLRSQVEDDIRRLGLDAVCTLWGEAKPDDVVTLLSLSDIFLYSGTRGTNYSMAVLEAMAAGCAVVASIAPRSNARLLAEGRGIAIKPGDAEAIAQALTRLCNEPECCRAMGQRARDYVSIHHSTQNLRETLLHAVSLATKHKRGVQA